MVGKRKKPAAAVEDMMDYLRERALELGAEKAKIIDTDTVVMAEWVRWKCLYGCPLYAKDPFHPPVAPDAESTKKVLREYTKAILLNGPDGQTLTEAAVKLEGEAYHRGYYKAFALTALVPSGGAAYAPPGPAPATGST
jgi:predicted metal-binding protein